MQPYVDCRDVAARVKLGCAIKVWRRFSGSPQPVQTPAVAQIAISSPRIQLNAAPEPLHRLLCQFLVVFAALRGLEAIRFANGIGGFRVPRLNRESVLQEVGLRGGEAWRTGRPLQPNIFRGTPPSLVPEVSHAGRSE